MCTVPESSDNVPDDLFLAWPGLAVSVLDGLDNDKMCACAWQSVLRRANSRELQ
ncbi:hypothetical protein PILCRDRAFT_826986 [Piloderma croceum F 1598]|uniref:Uncharacterized protein n=1 Tax=Piloderma croceum (strain F 1598) TaxID=765440 RepID=A0A0C3ET33_PILCF|nr:hypothetical protein PILCRDRAFT_826986 [Piloderma croceum F 1598]